MTLRNFSHTLIVVLFVYLTYVGIIKTPKIVDAAKEQFVVNIGSNYLSDLPELKRKLYIDCIRQPFLDSGLVESSENKLRAFLYSLGAVTPALEREAVIRLAGVIETASKRDAPNEQDISSAQDLSKKVLIFADTILG